MVSDTTEGNTLLHTEDFPENIDIEDIFENTVNTDFEDISENSDI